MDWSYIAGFFDGEGNLHINKILNKDKKIKAYQIAVRFYNSDIVVLSTIKEFLGYGVIYSNKRESKPDGVYELSITSKKDVKNTLLHLEKHSISKKAKIIYLLTNFNFERNNNSGFDLETFHKMTERKNAHKFYVERSFLEKTA